MNNSIKQNTNQRFNLVKDEMKRLLSVVLGSIQESQEDNGFDYYINKDTNLEDAKIAEYLKQDMLDREKRIEEYEISKQRIKISSKSKGKQTKKQSTIEIANPIINNEKLVKSKEEPDIEL